MGFMFQCYSRYSIFFWLPGSAHRFEELHLPQRTMQGPCRDHWNRTRALGPCEPEGSAILDTVI